MKNIELYDFTKKDFNRIWTRRSQLPKTWEGDDPKPVFDYNNPDNAYFLKSNWNDPALSDLLEILYDIDIYETKEIRSVRIQKLCLSYDEARYIIRNDYDIYVLSQYKSRGNIQSFVATEYGEQIHIYEFTQLLIDLGLEEIKNG